MKPRHSFRLLSLFAFSFLLSIISCKTDPSSGSPDSTTKVKSFTVVTHQPSEPDNLNPILGTTTYSRQVTNQVFSHLVHYDTKTLKASPMLAKAMPSVEKITEGKHAGRIASTFEIHDEAVWDNGTPVTGHDVDFTIKTMLNPKVPAGPLRPYIQMYKSIEIDPSNPKKFTMYSDEYFLVNELFTNFPICPAYHYDSSGIMKNFTIEELSDADNAKTLGDNDPRLDEFAKQFTNEKYAREKDFVIGCGPYELVEWITGQRVVIKKKKNWWGEKLGDKYPLLQANPEKVIFKPITDLTTALTELKAGSIDLMSLIKPKDFKKLQENEMAKKNLNMHTPMLFAYYFININNNNPLLEDKKVRRAIAHAVDVEQIIKTAMNGYGKRTKGPFHPSKSYYHQELPLIDFDIEKARTLLEEAGWTDTNNDGTVDKEIGGERREMVLKYLASTQATSQSIGRLFKGTAKKAGIKVELDIKEFNVLRKDLANRNFELAGAAFGQDPSLDDPKQIWHTSSDTPSGFNRAGFGNAESDAIIDEIRITFDEGKRNELYRKFQEIVYEEQPVIFLLIPQGRFAINKKFNAEPSLRKPNIFENQFSLTDDSIAEQ